jgi:ABC-type transport system involved in Fe-S cluster assembly fused permease/ATPase subunit
VAQSLIFTVGLLCASFLAVYEVSRGTQPVGSFVTLLSYWAQLAGPLSFFANFYRKVQTQMLDAEKLLALFQEKPSVADEPRAIELKKVEGIVDFENVCFSYDSRKPAITDVSFHVPAGTTVAFVGETGGGKTTCLKLLFRFYDVASGAIKIDGHDIRDIKLSCLRDHLGVVPQVSGCGEVRNLDANEDRTHNYSMTRS